MKERKTTQCSTPPIKTIVHEWVSRPSSHMVQLRWKQVRSWTQKENPQIKHKIIVLFLPFFSFPFISLSPSHAHTCKLYKHTMARQNIHKHFNNVLLMYFGIILLNLMIIDYVDWHFVSWHFDNFLKMNWKKGIKISDLWHPVPFSTSRLHQQLLCISYFHTWHGTSFWSVS